MNKTVSLVFGALIALILLLLYAGTFVFMIEEVISSGAKKPDAAIDFPPGLLIVTTAVGGLVSALVVAKLAITQPGDNPGVIKYAEKSPGVQRNWVTVIAVCYIAIWAVLGLAALVVGVIVFPNVNKTVSDLGTAWLGLAVGAVYAYFGIRQH